MGVTYCNKVFFYTSFFLCVNCWEGIRFGLCNAAVHLALISNEVQVVRIPLSFTLQNFKKCIFILGTDRPRMKVHPSNLITGYFDLRCFFSLPTTIDLYTGAYCAVYAHVHLPPSCHTEHELTDVSRPLYLILFQGLKKLLPNITPQIALLTLASANASRDIRGCNTKPSSTHINKCKIPDARKKDSEQCITVTTSIANLKPVSGLGSGCGCWPGRNECLVPALSRTSRLS